MGITRAREVWRGVRDKGRKGMLKNLKDGRMKRVYTRVFRKEAAELDRSCVVEGTRADRKVHTTKEAVGNCQRDFFRKWFREGMPSRIWWTLGLLGVKELPHLGKGRKVCEEDYTKSSRGLMQEITEEVWDNYWGMKKRNKAADKDGTTANMFIGLMQELGDSGGKASGVKEVRTQRQFAAFRILLNLVLETGAVYESWAPEVLLTVPKVAGSEAMADVRPLGLIIILRNAFFGIQFVGVKRAQHELGVLSQNQYMYGGLRGLGTEGSRLVQNCAYEIAWVHRKSVGGGMRTRSMRLTHLPSPCTSALR